MGIPSWAVKGAKVVCIRKARVDNSAGGVVYPQVGQTYTIRDVGPHPRGGPGIRLVEITNPVLNYQWQGLEYRAEGAWMLGRFRPAVPPKTEAEDLELFAPFLEPPLVRIPHRGPVRA